MRLIQGLLIVGLVCSAVGWTPAVVAAGDNVATADDLVLRGDAKCTSCHDQEDSPELLAIGKTRHGVNADSRTPTCTSCHGESDGHANNPQHLKKRPGPDRTFTKDSTTPVKVRNDACIACHKGDNRTHWTASRHEVKGLACASCHDIHTEKDKVLNKATQSEVCYTCHKTQRAQSHLISTHPIAEGKVACSDCHNPHGSEAKYLMKKLSINDTCYQCHAEKRGPFLWEHPPAVDNCMNCHTPHGSTNPDLLRMRSPWLCQRCHGDGAPHPGAIYSGANSPGGTVNKLNSPTSGAGSYVNPLTGKKIAQTNPASQLALRGCSNCHSQVHGSNHPAGKWFAR